MTYMYLFWYVQTHTDTNNVPFFKGVLNIRAFGQAVALLVG